MNVIARALTRWLQHRESPAPTPDVSHLDRLGGVGTRPNPLAEWAAVVAATDPGTPVYDQAVLAAQYRGMADDADLLADPAAAAAIDHELAGLLDQEESR